MPGLKLTEAQAARLWSCDAQIASAVLARLTETLFLVRIQGGGVLQIVRGGPGVLKVPGSKGS
jgi:hypothetical protein